MFNYFVLAFWIRCFIWVYVKSLFYLKLTVLLIRSSEMVNGDSDLDSYYF